MNRFPLISTVGRIIMLMFGLFLCNAGIGQTNASVLNFHLKQSTSTTFTLKSTSTPSPRIDLQIPDWGNLSQPTESENGEYEVTYTAPSDYEGEFSFLIEYTGTSFFPYVNSYTRFTEIRVQVSRSLIQPTDDIIVLDGSDFIDIYPSTNDIHTDGPLNLIQLANVQFGEAEILDASTIRYSPPLDFKGRDIINYIVEDNIGNKGNGVIYIVSETQVNNSDSVYLIVSSEYSQYIFLPKRGMSLNSHTGGNGNLESVNEIAFKFSPIAGRTGNDVLIFDDGNGYARTVFISLIDNAPDADLVKDDKVYTAIGREIVFNVSKNDLISGDAIVYHSPELTNLGGGQFSYLPPDGFVGFKEFVYKVNTGSQFLTGNVTLKIDNYYPLPIAYHFKIVAGQPLVLNYDVPIEGMGFNPLSLPSYGDLEYFGQGSTIALDCGEINSASVIYTPIESYSGVDEFDLEYCIDNDQCKVVKVTVEIVDDPSEDCLCVDGCVWPGDADANGVVDLSDMLPIGYYMGETGSTREENTLEWESKSSPEWLRQQVSGVNLKHVDGNGDGMITHADTASVINNFGKYHSLIPSSVQVLKKSPIILIPRTTEVDSGDLMVIDIALGNSLNPVLDIHGLTFQLNIPPSLIDSSSFEGYYHDDSWIADGFGVMQRFIQPQEGIINSVLTKTNGLPKSGDGIIGTTIFIVEDEINGFRVKDGINKLPFDIDINNIIAYDSYGQQYTLPLSSARIFLNISDKSSEIDPTIDIPHEELKENLIVYPNPVKDQLNIHLNGSTNIHKVTIYDLLGRIIYNNSSLNTDRISIDVNNYQSGIYMLEITNGEEVSIKKIKIAK